MVLADGAFDPLHWGHLLYLRAASTWGRPLVVNIAPDEAIIAKGRVPFQTRFERARTVWALDMVDLVTQAPLAEVIRARKPTHLVKGKDWRDCLPPDVLLACHDVGTQIVFTDTQTRTSTERLAG